MRTAIAILFFFSCSLNVSAQEIKKIFLEAGFKRIKHTVIISNDVAFAYATVVQTDQASANSSHIMLIMDTLYRQADSSYVGYATEITRKNGAYRLVFGPKKTVRTLRPVKDENKAVYDINNAYFMKRYFTMCREINAAYPLHHYTFREGYRQWNALNNRSEDIGTFKTFTDRFIYHLQDSISRSQDHYAVITEDIVQHLDSMPYEVFKEKISRLPAVLWQPSRYYVVAVNEAAERKPEYFFRLAEDFPENKNLIFDAVEKDKKVLRGLKAVEGYTLTKNDFFRRRK